MKHLRTYEAYIDDEDLEPIFKVGDTVVSVDFYNCFDNIDDNLIKGDRYIITGTEKLNIGGWRCTVEGKSRRYYCTRFLTEFEYNANKYNI